jgi:excisionase family DNA binding protein
MEEQASKLMSTGEAARLLGVQPDTVLKWIKKGTIRAMTTAGGHHRLDATEIEKMLPRPASSHTSAEQPLRCWQYFSRDGTPQTTCLECVVYRVRAALCFEMMRIEGGPKPLGQFCASSCETCPYYQRVHGMAPRILIVTDDRHLFKQGDGERSEEVDLQFASTPYTASAAMASFRPTFVIVDVDLTSCEWRALVEAIAQDLRIPGVRIFLAKSRLSRGRAEDKPPEIAGVIEKPFGEAELLAITEAVRVETI